MSDRIFSYFAPKWCIPYSQLEFDSKAPSKVQFPTQKVRADSAAQSYQAKMAGLTIKGSKTVKLLIYTVTVIYLWLTQSIDRVLSTNVQQHCAALLYLTKNQNKLDFPRFFLESANKFWHPSSKVSGTQHQCDAVERVYSCYSHLGHKDFAVKTFCSLQNCELDENGLKGKGLFAYSGWSQTISDLIFNCESCKDTLLESKNKNMELEIPCRSSWPWSCLYVWHVDLCTGQSRVHIYQRIVTYNS